jgi:hypothetical protein
MRERHAIDESTSVIIWETRNTSIDRRRAEDGEPTERYSYLIEYRDRAGKLRESEPLSGFIGPDHCISDARQSIKLDELDMEPEPEPAPPEPRITAPHHTHLCYDGGCGIHRCVNPACYSNEHGFPCKVAESLCPNCGKQTGVYSFAERMRYATVEFMPLVIEASAA